MGGYEEAFDYPLLWSGYWNNIVYTVVGVVVSLVCTIPCAYSLSRYDMAGRRPLMFLFTFTMFFSGGMVPLYLTIQDLELYNTLWALVLPMAVSVYNLIVCRSFFLMLILAIGQIMGLGYEKAFLMQTGTNTTVSEIINTYTYKVGLQGAQYSFATAVGLFNSVVNFIILVLANFVSKKTADVSIF